MFEAARRLQAKPLFIVLEGGEGSGKSTQARVLFHRLQREDIPSFLTRDPGGTRLGRAIERKLKLSRNVPAQTELLLFAAARSQLTAEVILPELRRGIVVVSDRFAPSTTAYQGYGRGIDLQIVEDINRLATRGLHPDLVVLLDTPPQLGLDRKGGLEKDRFHREDGAFHRKVRNGYLEMARAEPECWLVVDGTQSKAAVSAAIWARVSKMVVGTRVA